ncbi:hypothetical protein [Spiroplasma cantharicola]|uniref:Transmembrane protein n=1 Tax=Spiroplasma cantharicola TaxID=362837 RepID=A0A0M3SJD3_9MOLU|nr:hypothetical protein [Spiroplasma cantharicola]ALD66534.1 hypothetical protein SCANT_v1c06280 [Spiroplasma cantharicola]
MIYSNIWSGSVISGYIFSIFTSITLVYFFILYSNRLRKMNSLKVENKYFNKKLNNFFVYYLLIGFTLMFLSLTVFFIINLVFKNMKYLGFGFTIYYLIYTIQVLIYIILLNIKQNSIIAFVHDSQLFLFNEIITLENIIEITHNFKRTLIFITYKDEKEYQDIIKLKYNLGLYDYLKKIN